MASITPELLRAYLLASCGDSEDKASLSYRFRKTHPNEQDEANGGNIAMDILVDDRVSETNFYYGSEAQAIDGFLRDSKELIRESLLDAKAFVRELAEAAISAGLLPN